MTNPEEEQKKAAELRSREQAKPEKHSTPVGDAFTFVGQLVGDAKNLAVDAVAGTHSGDKVLSGITPQLAAQYQRGKEIHDRIGSGALKSEQLSETDKKSLEAFNSVRKSISQVPLYDRESLMRYVEKGIEQKSKTISVKPTGGESAKPVSGEVKPAPLDTGKPVLRDGKVAGHEVAKPGLPDAAKPGGHEAVRPSNHDVVRPGVPDASKPVASDSSRPTREVPKPMAFDSVSTRAPESSVHESAKTVSRDGSRPPADTTRGDLSKDFLPKNIDVSSANTSANPPRETVPTSQHSGPAQKIHLDQMQEAKQTALSAQATARDETDRQYKTLPTAAPVEGLTSRRGEPNEKEMSEATDVVQRELKTTFFRMPDKLSLLDSKSIATGTFARRTAYDAQARHESSQENKKHESKLDFVVLAHFNQLERSSSFANMRRIFDERTAAAMSIEKHSTGEMFSSRMRGQLSQVESASASFGASGRSSLAEIRTSLPADRVQRIIRYSEERFPSGLRWQSTFKQSDGGQSNPLRTGQSLSFGTYSIREQPQLIVSGKNLILQGRAQDRYITGAEIALAAIIAAAGAKRLRCDEVNPTGSDVSNQGPRVQKIEAFMPNMLKPEKVQEKTGTKNIESSNSGIGSLNSSRATIIASSRLDAHRVAEVARLEPDKYRAPQEKVPIDSTVFHTHGGKFYPSEKRFITGAEIALAAVLASCGTARVRETFAEKEQDHTSESQIDSSEKSSMTIRKTADSTDDDIPGTMRYLQKHRYNRTTRIIAPHDTFVSIAESSSALHNNARYAWLIADINLPRIKQNYLDGKRVVEVRSRQLIEIPSMADIVAFNRNFKEEYKPENLITVVIETQLDRELLNEHFSVFVEGPRTLSAHGASHSLLARNVIGGDAAAALPPLAVDSASALKVARQQLSEITQRLLDSGRRPLARIANSLRRDRIKRNLYPKE